MKVEYTVEYKVLIIDDSTEDRIFYRYLLNQDLECTYHFAEFACGEEALNWCRKETPDVILLDYMLPDCDGLTLLTQLKQQTDNRPLPVIMLTGEGDERIAVQAIKNGAQDYLVKNKLTHDLLCRAIHSVVEQVRLLEQVRQQQAQLQKLNAALEMKARERTSELQATNSRLQQELLRQQITQKALQKQAELLDLARDGILMLDMTGVITFWNRGAEHLYGWTKTEAVGKIADELLQTQSNRPLAEIKATLLNQGFWEGELTHTHRNSTSIHVSSRWVLRRNSWGKPIGILKINSDITKRQQAEEALKMSEARWNFALAGNGHGVWDWDIQTNKVFYSQRWKEMLGFSHDEIGDDLDEWNQRIHPDDKAEVWSELEKHLRGGFHQYTSEHRVLCKDGTYRWFLDRGQVISRTEAGEPLRMIGTYTDITKRKQAEEALKHSEATKRAIIAAIPDLLIRMKQNGTCIDFLANSEFNIIKPEQFKQNITIFEVMPEDLAHQRIHSIQQALQTQKMQTYEQRIIIKGQLRCEEVRIVPVEDDEVLIMIRDVTDRTMAEEKLRRSEAALREAQHIAHIANWEMNVATEEITYSDELLQMLGIDPTNAEPIHTQYLNCIHPEDQVLLLQHLNRAIQQGIPYKLDLRFFRTDGTIGCMEARGEVAFDEQGKVVRLFGTALDISKRKRAELELQQAKEDAEAANQAKSVFLANMSHELRTPLNVILGFTQILRRNTSLAPEHHEPIQIIHRSGEHLLNLINDILDLSKIEAGRATSNESNFDLLALLKTVKDMLTHRATVKGLYFHLSIDSNVPQYITADADKLRQILLNLLSNAIKFTERGSVSLRVSPAPTPLHTLEQPSENPEKLTLLFEVEDTGLGIEAHETDLIFNAFAQSQVGKATPGGTGLGLTISRHFVELMGGHISVHSNPGQGSLFEIRLPVQVTQGADVSSIEPSHPLMELAADQPSYRILVVDDQLENRMLLVQLMSRLGMEVQEAANGEEAVRLWQQWQPHLIWMDIQMPVVDGYEATRQIRFLETQTQASEKFNQNIKQYVSRDALQANQNGLQSTIIIALTAYASKGDRNLTLVAGCNDFVTKPFTENLLYDKMAEYLGLRFLDADHASANLPSAQVADGQTAESLAKSWGESLAAMPLDWLCALNLAAQLCDEDDVKLLIQQIPETHAALAKQLNHLVHDYQFEKIRQLLQQNSTG
jgi:PAS domain S-box-containing protein